MKIVVGKTAGVCGGVITAIHNTEKYLNKSKKGYCLGELVHNTRVVQELEEKGLTVIEELKEGIDSVIIRAHGIEKQTYEKAEKMGITVLDFTCKKVLRIHELAKKYAKKGYYIVLVGKRRHPETIGTYSFCGEYKSVIEHIDNIETVIEEIKKSPCHHVLVLSQTTFHMEKFEEIADKIKSQLENITTVKIYNTICKATEHRQEETKTLAKQVDCMIIIGGKQSSNTNKLNEIAKENCRDVFFIETKDELNKEEIKRYHKIGIMAGASTPKKYIEEVISYIEET